MTTLPDWAIARAFRELWQEREITDDAYDAVQARATELTAARARK